MHTLFKISLSAALGMAAVSPAFADETPIYVSSHAAFDQWQADVKTDLDRKLRQAASLHKGRSESGIVQIRFRLDEDGNPTDLKTYRSSASRAAESIAFRAVGKLRDLDEAPVTGARDAEFLANVIFARDTNDHARLAAKLDQFERVRLASNDSDRALIVMGS